MRDLNQAKEILQAEGHNCVLCRGERFWTSEARGVKPLVGLIESGENYTGFSAADKVVGRATAFLYVLLGVRAVYARVISKSALQVLQDAGIEIEYDTLTAHIINRQGDGICPFEEAVLVIGEAQEAYGAIRKKMQEMGITL